MGDTTQAKDTRFLANRKPLKKEATLEEYCCSADEEEEPRSCLICPRSTCQQLIQTKSPAPMPPGLFSISLSTWVTTKAYSHIFMSFSFLLVWGRRLAIERSNKLFRSSNLVHVHFNCSALIPILGAKLSGLICCICWWHGTPSSDLTRCPGALIY